MNLSIVFYFTLLLTFTNGGIIIACHVCSNYYFGAFISTLTGKLLEFSYTREVNEGEWASFSCAVKLGKARVRWKIGNYTDEVGNGMKYIGSHGLVVRQYDDRELTEKYKDKGLTFGIEVLATAELNGVPVQCVAFPLDLSSLSIEYSKFIILNVITDLNTTNQGEHELHRALCTLIPEAVVFTFFPLQIRSPKIFQDRETHVRLCHLHHHHHHPEQLLCLPPPPSPSL